MTAALQEAQITEFTEFVATASHVNLQSATHYAEILGVSLEIGVLAEYYLRLQYTRLSHLSREIIRDEYFNRGIKSVAAEHLEELREQFELTKEIRELAKSPFVSEESVEFLLNNHRSYIFNENLAELRDKLRKVVEHGEQSLKRKKGVTK